MTEPLSRDRGADASSLDDEQAAPIYVRLKDVKYEERLRRNVKERFRNNWNGTIKFSLVWV